MSKSPLQSPYQAFLSLLARYATFLRYCAVGALASGVFYGVANLSALLLKQVDSRENAQNLESTFEKTLSSRADEVGVAIHKGAKVDSSKDYSASAECMDCHAANAARNDKNNPSKKVDSNAFAQNAQNLETPQATNRQLQNVSEQAQDSRIFDKNAEILQNNDSTNAARRQDFKTFESNAQNVSESAQDSRILELQIGVFQGSQGDKTSGLSTKRADEIHDFSPKAESSNQISTQNLATLLGSLASFLFGYFAQMRLAFRAYPNHSTMLPRYLIVLALIALYAQIIAYLGAFFTLSYYLISAFIALSVPLFSYPLQKLWVFAKTSKGGGRLSKDSAFGLESWISSPRFVNRPQVLSSLRGLKSHDSISKILESQSVDKQHTQILESAFYIIKAFFSSLRDTALAVAWQSKRSAASLENKRSGASEAKQVSLENKGYRSPLGDVSLESIQAKTQTLESKSGSKSHKTRRSRSFFSKSTASKFKLESTFSLSSRADEVGVAIHTSRLESTLIKLDSSISAFLNLIYFTQAHFLAVFFSPFLWLIGLTPRSFVRPLLLAPCSNFSKTNALFATAETMDCHADFQSARNDRNNATFGKADSRSKAQPIRHDSKHCGRALHSIPKPKTPQAAGFLMKKPTPKSSKNEDSRSKAKPTHHDSKHCGGAVVALRDFGGRARLEVCGCPKNRAINRIAYPRLNRQHPISFLKESL